MSRFVMGSFEREEDLVEAVRAARLLGCRVRDVYTPYAVHGLEEVLGWKRSWLAGACFVWGLTGAVLALGFQFWTSARDWPLNVGGRPFNALPAFVPVTFEAMVLLGGLGLVLTWLIVCRLYPGKKPVPLWPHVTDNHFALVLEQAAEPFDPAAVRQLFEDCHAVRVEEGGLET
jgi:hypothetical protein